MLLASLFSTETAEVWCRAAVGATMDTDDDAGPYFACPQTAGTPQRETISHASHTVTGSAEHPAITASSQDSSIVDEPTFSLPQHGLPIVPAFCIRIAVLWETVVYLSKEGSLPLCSIRFPNPPPRGPPVF